MASSKHHKCGKKQRMDKGSSGAMVKAVNEALKRRNELSEYCVRGKSKQHREAHDESD